VGPAADLEGEEVDARIAKPVEVWCARDIGERGDDPRERIERRHGAHGAATRRTRTVRALAPRVAGERERCGQQRHEASWASAESHRTETTGLIGRRADHRIELTV